jgi:hypothetical protein
MWFGDCHVLGDEFDLEPVVRDVTYGNDWEDSFGTFLRDDMSPFFQFEWLVYFPFDWRLSIWLGIRYAPMHLTVL